MHYVRQVNKMTAKEREDYDNEWVDQQFQDWMAKLKPPPTSSPPPDHVADPCDDLSLFVGLKKSFPSHGWGLSFS